MPVPPVVRVLAPLLAVVLAVAACSAAATPTTPVAPVARSGPTGPSAPVASGTAPAATGTGVGPASPTAGPQADRRPAAASGGVCEQLTFETVRRAVGTDFDVAASSGTAATSQSCVLQRVDARVPDLVLTVTPAPGVTPAVFQESYVPARGTPRSGVGRAAYSAVMNSASAAPRVELGWLSARGRVMTLTYTLGPEDDASRTGTFLGRLAVLAGAVDPVR